jgi:hypothetical protein
VRRRDGGRIVSRIRFDAPRRLGRYLDGCFCSAFVLLAASGCRIVCSVSGGNPAVFTGKGIC